MDMLKPTALVAGHYECRSLKQSLPILQDLLGLEVLTGDKGETVLKHPNTGWKLIAHESSPDAPDKPFQHHYGVRVATNREIDAAFEYLQSKKREYKIKIIQPKENHNAYSVHFFEPGGNFWEIESYEKADEAGMGKTTSPHWLTPLGEERFPGRGYVPQALTHGTVQFYDLDATRRFYENVLGLEVVQLWPSSIYVKHPASPWYIVNLPFRADPILPTRAQRFVLAVESPSRVEEGHRSFSSSGQELGITAVDPIQRSNGNASFVFSDLNRNWWEVTSAG
jgi:catechol 2,3-dioxygenase-like lactoylglutathione lyase family enzyme